ncbi:MerR family transcriptional regulator [Williamsia sp. M5A3_1d]
MRIGELSDRTGASVRSLRHYESRGLITSHRTTGGHRVFDEDTAGRVAMIRCLLDAGVPTRDMGEMLPCVHAGTVTQGTFVRLGDAHERLNRQIDDLVATRTHLEALIAAVGEATHISGPAPA